jgi:hypothetical protein
MNEAAPTRRIAPKLGESPSSFFGNVRTFANGLVVLQSDQPFCF